jgi:hypothetical protein
MEPTTIVLAISGVTLFAGLLFKVRSGKIVKETELMKNARVRAEKRATERSKSIVVDNEQNRTIDFILSGIPMPAKHRSVFPRGAGPNETAGVPLLHSAFSADNTDFSKQVEVQFLDADYNWPEKYDREDPPAPKLEVKDLNLDFVWPDKYARG